MTQRVEGERFWRSIDEAQVFTLDVVLAPPLPSHAVMDGPGYRPSATLTFDDHGVLTGIRIHNNLAEVA